MADVIGSLPKELAALGHEVRIFLPRYGTIDPAAGDFDTRALCVHFPCSATTKPCLSGKPRSLIRRSPSICLTSESSLDGTSRSTLGLDQRDEQRRFILFCRGLLEVLPSLGFVPISSTSTTGRLLLALPTCAQPIAISCAGSDPHCLYHP